MNAAYWAVTSVAGFAISLSFAVANNRFLSPVGYAWLLMAVLILLWLLPLRRIAVIVVAFFLRNAPRARSAGGAARPYVQAAGQAIGRGAQTLRQKASAAMRWVCRKAMENRLFTLGILLVVFSAVLYSKGEYSKAFLVFMIGVGCVVLHYSILLYGKHRVQQSIIASMGWVVRKLVEVSLWLGKLLVKAVTWALTELINFLVQLLSGKRGWGVACLGGAVIAFSLGLVGLMNPGLMEKTKAEWLIAISPFLFIASVWIGTDKLADKKLVK